MAFLEICRSDPLLEFIRKTFDAIPLRYPDSRVTPLGVIAVAKSEVRIMGQLANLTDAAEWKEPSSETVDVPDIAGNISSQFAWKSGLSLLAPFLSHMFDVGQGELSARIGTGRDASNGVRVSLARAQRTFVAPLVCSRALQLSTFRVPAQFLTDSGETEVRFHLIDSVLTAREIELSVGENTATNVVAGLQASLAGKASSNAVRKSKTGVTITGNKRAPFAFTCLEMVLEKDGVLNGLKIPSKSDRLGATGIGGSGSISHTQLGAINEFVIFDS
jgi:hypothetical protein